MRHILILLFFLAASAPVFAQTTPPTMADYWAGNASWKFVRKFSPGSPGNFDGLAAGAQMKIMGNTWYYFTRKYVTAPAGACAFQNNVALGMEVRSSTDKGATWSNPTQILFPQANTPWACSATDGDLIYDSATTTWKFLYQCLGSENLWRGCYAERHDSNPAGPFTPLPNPVIESKALWSQICNDGNDKCVQQAGGINRVFDEGTYNIFDFDGTNYFVGFHGYDGVNGYIGFAKTPNFQTWSAGGANGTPTDAVLTRDDATSWRESWLPPGNIGVGARQMIKENGYYYMVTEAADVNLACTHGQHWDAGFYRSQSITNLNWEQYPLGNPVFYSSLYPDTNGQANNCNLQYVGIFRDPLTLKYYVHMYRMANDINQHGTYFYELVDNKNLLKNADLWMCQPTPDWHVLSPSGSGTQYAVYRFPLIAPDANCYMETNCGAATCTPGQSVYQDIDLGAQSITNIRFGGKFSASANSTHQLTIHELDANGVSLRAHTLQIPATTTFQSFESTAPIFPTTRFIRFQLYLQGPQNVRLDELFVEPTTGENIPGDLNTDTHVNFQDILIAAGNLFGSLYSIFTYNQVVSNFGR